MEKKVEEKKKLVKCPKCGEEIQSVDFKEACITTGLNVNFSGVTYSECKWKDPDGKEHVRVTLEHTDDEIPYADLLVFETCSLDEADLDINGVTCPLCGEEIMGFKDEKEQEKIDKVIAFLKGEVKK